MQELVQKKIKEKNLWYVGDQFLEQYSTYGQKRIIKNRWRIILGIIEEWIKGHENPPVKFNLLDAGCGDGINIGVIKSYFINEKIKFEMYLSDFNNIRLSRAINLEEKVLQADLCKLPFKDNAFDFILCNHVLEHIEKDYLALSELKRVLKQGGLLILGVPNEGCLMASIRNKILQTSILKYTDHVNFYTNNKILELNKLVGFEQFISIKREGFFYPHHRLSIIMSESRIGRFITKIIGNVFSSQSSGLYFSFTKK